MNLAKTEDWRFCPSCHHMQNLSVEPDIHPVCPELRRGGDVGDRRAPHATAIPPGDCEQQRSEVRIGEQRRGPRTEVLRAPVDGGFPARQHT